MASYSAYADWLQEQGDPRGEFIAVQLALEDESRPKDARDTLKAREAELLAAHEREWLGELAPYLLDREADDDEQPRIEYRWQRGFLESLDALYVSRGLGQAIVSSPVARLLRELRIRGAEESHAMKCDGREPRVPTPSGFGEHHGYFELLGSRCLESVRIFRIGDDEDEPAEDHWVYNSTSCLDGLDHILISMPRVEELHLLSNSCNLQMLFSSVNLKCLRVLRAYHIGSRRDGYDYPLDVLAANPTFSNLTHLQFHPHCTEWGYEAEARSFIPIDQVRALLRSPHLKKLTHLQLRLSDMGDDGIREIIASGISKQLRWLDLRHGCVTDDGARLLAACPDAKRLERIDLSRNAVTADGLAALRAAGVNAIANNPLTPNELESREYLHEGDFE